MVQVKVSETYDLSTQVDKMGIIGIHTPSSNALAKMWEGFTQNYRYMKLVGCDVTIACASMLPADPMQVGVEAGKIAPQDMFNPILFKAVSNESFNTLVSRIYTGTSAFSGSSIDVNTVSGASGGTRDEFKIYYSLLADPDGWRKAMPQHGLEMRGLYPIVYSVVNQYGNYMKPGTAGYQPGGYDVPVATPDPNNTSKTKVDFEIASTSIRGPSMRMPRIPTRVPKLVNAGAGQSDGLMSEINEFLTTYVAAIIVPPAKLNKLYYRMKVTWTIEFEEVRPLTEYLGFSKMEALADATYGTDYSEQSKIMTTKTDTVDATGADVEKVMEGTR